MISNYVKKKLVSNPVKKQYSREQIAYLLFIAVAKSALSMDEIKLVLEMNDKLTVNEKKAKLEELLDEFEITPHTSIDNPKLTRYFLR